MRWPFGHRSTSPDRTASPPPGLAAAARPHDAWRQLPAVQRVVGRPPLVAPAAPFAERLATRRAPELALEPLGHEVSPLATPGRLIGVARPAAAAIAGPVELPVELPLQRIARAAATATEAGWSSFDAPSADPDVRAEGTVPGTVRFERLAPGNPILTSSAEAGVPPAPAGRLDLRAGGAAAERLAATPLTAAPLPVAPAGPAIQRLEAPAPVGAAAAATAVQPASTPAPAPARRPTLGEARRLGLGAPLRPGTTPAVQRSVEPAGGAAAFLAGGLPVAPPASITGIRPAGGAAGEPATAGPGPNEDPDGAPDRTELPVVRPIAIQRMVAGDVPFGVRDAGAQPADEPAGLPVAPLAGRAALLGVAPDRLNPLEAQIAGAGTPAGSPVTSTGDTPPAMPPISGPGEWTAPVGGGPIRVSSPGSLLAPVQRTAWVAGGRPASGRSEPGVLAGVSVGPLGRAEAGPAWSPASGPADRPGRPTDPGQAVQRSSSARLVEPAGLALVPAPAGRPTAIEASRPAPAPVVTIQREPDPPSPAAAPAGGSTAVADAAAATASVAGLSGAGASPADRDRELDDLARRLYGRIRARLSAELLADRERAGSITDLR